MELSHQHQSIGRLLKNSNWISQDLMEGLQFDDVAQLENTFYVKSAWVTDKRQINVRFRQNNEKLVALLTNLAPLDAQ